MTAALFALHFNELLDAAVMRKAILTTKIGGKIKHIEGFVDARRDKLYLTKYKCKAYFSILKSDEVSLKSEGI